MAEDAEGSGRAWLGDGGFDGPDDPERNRLAAQPRLGVQRVDEAAVVFDEREEPAAAAQPHEHDGVGVGALDPQHSRRGLAARRGEHGLRIAEAPIVVSADVPSVAFGYWPPAARIVQRLQRRAAISCVRAIANKGKSRRACRLVPQDTHGRQRERGSTERCVQDHRIRTALPAQAEYWLLAAFRKRHPILIAVERDPQDHAREFVAIAVVQCAREVTVGEGAR